MEAFDEVENILNFDEIEQFGGDFVKLFFS